MNGKGQGGSLSKARRVLSNHNLMVISRENVNIDYFDLLSLTLFLPPPHYFMQSPLSSPLLSHYPPLFLPSSRFLLSLLFLINSFTSLFLSLSSFLFPSSDSSPCSFFFILIFLFSHLFCLSFSLCVFLQGAPGEPGMSIIGPRGPPVSDFLSIFV